MLNSLPPPLDNSVVSGIGSANLQNLFQSFKRLKRHIENYIEGKAAEVSVIGLLLGLEAFTKLACKFHLSPFEQTILLLTIALELEPNFQLLCAKAQDDPQKNYATLGLALSALPDADWSVLSPQSPLHYWRLIQIEPGRLLTEAPLKIDRRILCYLLGEPAISLPLADLVTPLSTQTMADISPPFYQTISEQIVAVWSASPPNQQSPLISLIGTDAAINLQVAAAACNRLGFQLITLSTAVLPTNPQDLKQLQRHWEREAILSNSVLLLDRDVTAPDDPGREAAIVLFLETLNTPVILSSRDRLPQLRRPLITIDVPSLPHDEQKALWQAHLGTAAAILDGDVGSLANQFKLGPTAIQTVCLQATSQMTVESAESSQAGATPTSLLDSKAALHDTLWALCRRQARPNLDTLAQRIDPTATWDDLVLPDRQRQVLEDIATHLKYRARVYQDWGVRPKERSRFGGQRLVLWRKRRRQNDGGGGVGQQLSARPLPH